MKLELVINKDVVQGTVNEVELIESKAQRDELAGRVGVLEKVKGLLLFPNMEFATNRQIAEFYEVPVKTIQKIYTRHIAEIREDGYTTMTGKMLAENLATNMMSTAKVTREKGHILIEFDGMATQIPYSTIGLYPKRAILRIGMLLRDSEVAREVRTQLLNIEEKASKEVKVAEINNELELQMELARALMNGDVQAVALVNAKIIEYKNRHIAKVEAKLNEVTEERDSLGEKVSAFIESDEVYTFGEVAEGIDGLSAQALREFLQVHGVLGHKSRGEVYRPIGKYKGLGWFSTQTRVAKWSGVTFTNTYITTKGRMEIAEFYKKVQAQEMSA
ncbi:hypothetical protein ABH61_02105 [Bacillus paranthracis]|uniref:Antirepressor protein C-terminal domain-containing protein n=3 Tax=Bacillus TaxID=1386 RepID=B9IZ59_BACCQ|nr:hypothetical protein BCQ_4271 [Bacillus cereus Q1]MBY5227617.1 hypothetical protein [Bacillus paranthracis]MDR4158809.1 hypothetical protein [Bacillus paranthracis]HDR3662275.1 phage antirepressor KilAC domain-containing protein [Bacillus paranthracis]